MPKKKKKTNKYSVGNIARSFGAAAKSAGQKYAEAQRKKKEYLASPAYKKKVAEARAKQLKELDYQIALARKQKALAKARSNQNAKLRRQVNRPMGIDIGSELGLS